MQEPAEARMSHLLPIAVFLSAFPGIHFSLLGGEELLPVLKQRNVETVEHPRNQTARAKTKHLKKTLLASMLSSYGGGGSFERGENLKSNNTLSAEKDNI